MERDQTQQILKSDKDKADDQETRDTENSGIGVGSYEPLISEAYEGCDLVKDRQNPGKLSQIQFLKSSQQGKQQFLQESNRYSSYYKQYLEFIQKYHNISASFIQQMLKTKHGITSQTFQDKGIIIIDDYQEYERKLEDQYRIVPTKYHRSQEGNRIDYKVCISKFEIPVSVKVFNGPCQSKSSEISQTKGTFGEVYKYKMGDSWYCLKKIYFTHAKQFNQEKKRKKETYRSDQFEYVVKEVGLCKLLGILHVSPQLHQILPEVDLAVYEDCLCFITELCNPFPEWLDKCRDQQQPGLFKGCIEQKLSVTFSLKIIHRDIKLSNIVYNERSKSYLLIDFGLSHAVSAGIFQQAPIKRPEGTLGYTHQKVLESSEFYLQYADYYSFCRTLERLSNKETKYNTIDIPTIELNQPKKNEQLGKLRIVFYFFSLIKPLHLNFQSYWKEIISTLPEEQKQKEQERLKSYFTESLSSKVIRSVQQLLEMQFEQGVESMFRLNQVCNFYYVLELNQSQQAPNNLETLERRIKMASRLKATQIKLNYKMNRDFLKEYLELIKDLLGLPEMNTKQRIKQKQYYQFAQKYLREDSNSAALYGEFQSLMNQINPGDKKFKLYLKRWQNIVFLKQFNDHTHQYIQRVLEKIQGESAAIFLIDCALVYSQKHDAKYFDLIDQYLSQAGSILESLEINYNYSRIALKLQFVKILHLSQSVENEEDAFILTLEVKENIKRYFGAGSYYYLSLLLNQAYLSRKNCYQSNLLIQQIIQNSHRGSTFSVLGEYLGTTDKKDLSLVTHEYTLFQDKDKSVCFSKEYNNLVQQNINPIENQMASILIDQKMKLKLFNIDFKQFQKTPVMRIIDECYGQSPPEYTKQDLDNLLLFNTTLGILSLYTTTLLDQKMRVSNARLLFQSIISQALSQPNEVSTQLSKDSTVTQLFTHSQKSSLSTIINGGIFSKDNVITMMKGIQRVYIKKLRSGTQQTIGKIGAPNQLFDLQNVISQNIFQTLPLILCPNPDKCKQYENKACKFIHMEQFHNYLNQEQKKAAIEVSTVYQNKFDADLKQLKELEQLQIEKKKESLKGDGDKEQTKPEHPE